MKYTRTSELVQDTLYFSNELVQGFEKGRYKGHRIYSNRTIELYKQHGQDTPISIISLNQMVKCEKEDFEKVLTAGVEIQYQMHTVEIQAVRNFKSIEVKVLNHLTEEYKEFPLNEKNIKNLKHLVSDKEVITALLKIKQMVEIYKG